MNLVFPVSIGAVLLLVFVAREILSYRNNLTWKYFLTPMITLLIIMNTMLALLYNQVNSFRMLVLLALVLGLTGDVILMIEETNRFYHGLFFFLLGHIAYLFAFTIGYKFAVWQFGLIALLLGVNISLCIIIKRYNSLSKVIPVFVYGLLLGGMVVTALSRLGDGLNLQNVMIAVGAVLFAMSDMLLAVNTFVKKIPHSTVYTWLLYAPAQYLISLSCFK